MLHNYLSDNKRMDRNQLIGHVVGVLEKTAIWHLRSVPEITANEPHQTQMCSAAVNSVEGYDTYPADHHLSVSHAFSLHRNNKNNDRLTLHSLCI